MKDFPVSQVPSYRRHYLVRETLPWIGRRIILEKMREGADVGKMRLGRVLLPMTATRGNDGGPENSPTTKRHLSVDTDLSSVIFFKDDCPTEILIWVSIWFAELLCWWCQVKAPIMFHSKNFPKQKVKCRKNEIRYYYKLLETYHPQVIQDPGWRC